MKCLLDADYQVRGETPHIRLFYKTDRGRVTEKVSDFKPYFYALPRTSMDDARKAVESLEAVTSVETKKMFKSEGQTNVLVVCVALPRDVPRLRGEIRSLPEIADVFEADVPFARRYLIDSKTTPMQYSDKITLNVAAVDIEVYCRGEPKSDEDPVIMISYADTGGLRRVWTYKNPGVKKQYVEVLEGEEQVIKALVETIKKREVDVICGYNSDNFDMPYLKERSEILGLDFNLGFDDTPVKMERRGMNNGARITGRPHVDLYPIARQVYNFPRYRLEDVYEGIFGTRKVDIKKDDINVFWDSKKEGDLECLIEYSMSDVDATLEIAQQLLPLQYELSKLIKQPLYETSRMAAGQRVEYLLMQRACEKNILVPNRPGDELYNERGVDDKYEGAYVVEPRKGIHDNIVLFDFRSLYPSIIISHNVDPSTLDCGCCQEANKSPAGHVFCTNKKGFIPSVLKTLINLRVETKKQLKAEVDSGKKSQLDVRQNALKLLANSMYGYYGFQRARWYCRPCAESITSWGRDYIHKAIKQAEAEGFTVVYGDTDSVYLTYPREADEKKIVDKAERFRETLNQELPEAMELEFEGFYPRGVFITKKRYAVIGVDGKLTVKGLETRRRDWARLAKSAQERVLDIILGEKNPKKAAGYVKDLVQKVKAGDIPLEDLVIHTQMTRKIGDYVSEGPHVLAAKKALKNGREFRQGDIISYIVTRRGQSISDKAQLIDDTVEGDYDSDYYINNQLLPAVLRILEALGYQEGELKGQGKQMSLGDW
ncbi:MAG: DNA polymerase [Candidatus Altiarchaeales archaeon]|nr:DNA polymerase [Candidatus Altiarchaeales archaeon]